MNRFMGMMPSNEIEKTVTFKDMTNKKINIDAGPNGWTITYADYSTEYKDESIGTEANYENALKSLHEHFPENELAEISEINHHFAMPEEGIDGGEETLDDEDEKSCCSCSYFDGEEDDDDEDDGAEFD